MDEIKKKDIDIDILQRENIVTEKKTKELNEKMMNVALVERKMDDIEGTYVKYIRKIFSHYCISLSNLVIEANHLKNVYKKLGEVKISPKKIQVILKKS